MPPRHTRFMKGQSGNARGRPNGSKNLPTLLSETLNEPVIVAENGRRRKRSASAGRSSHSLSTDRPRAICAPSRSCSTFSRRSSAAPSRHLPRPPPSARRTRRSSRSWSHACRERGEKPMASTTSTRRPMRSLQVKRMLPEGWPHRQRRLAPDPDLNPIRQRPGIVSQRQCIVL
jgi:hypothetical protein